MLGKNLFKQKMAKIVNFSFFFLWDVAGGMFFTSHNLKGGSMDRTVDKEFRLTQILVREIRMKANSF